MNRIDTHLVRLRSRVVLAVAAAVVAALALAGPALADSATLTVNNNSGQSDPVGEVPRVFTVSGTAAVSEYLFVRYRAPGGAACAPTADSDSGSELYEFYGNEVNGSFSFQNAKTFSSGTYMFCIWLADSDTTVTSPITETITFRRPTGTISATFDPVVLSPGHQGTVTVTGTSEAPKEVFATVRAAGGQCAPTADADTGSNLIGGESVNGAFSVQRTLTEDAGSYVLCLWLADSDTDASPIAGPQAVPFTVGFPAAPAPACKVPGFNRTMKLSKIERKLAKAHCGVGAITRRHSKKVKRGYVLGLNPGSYTVLPNGSAVNVTISSGKKRRRHH